LKNVWNSRFRNGRLAVFESNLAGGISNAERGNNSTTARFVSILSRVAWFVSSIPRSLTVCENWECSSTPWRKRGAPGRSQITWLFSPPRPRPKSESDAKRRRQTNNDVTQLLIIYNVIYNTG
jgi:hypothetical protein